MAEARCIVIFPSTHFALRAERAALEAGIPAQMIPVPRHMSPDCNMGMEVPIEQENQLRALLADKGVDCSFVRRES
ncbi:MAG: DUF3343 domain-containing protein [Planctomycetota bacterium]